MILKRSYFFFLHRIIPEYGSSIVVARRVDGIDDTGAISQVTSAITLILKSSCFISSLVKNTGASLSQNIPLIIISELVANRWKYDIYLPDCSQMSIHFLSLP